MGKCYEYHKNKQFILLLSDERVLMKNLCKYQLFSRDNTIWINKKEWLGKIQIVILEISCQKRGLSAILSIVNEKDIDPQVMKLKLSTAHLDMQIFGKFLQIPMYDFHVSVSEVD